MLVPLLANRWPSSLTSIIICFLIVTVASVYREALTPRMAVSQGVLSLSKSCKSCYRLLCTQAAEAACSWRHCGLNYSASGFRKRTSAFLVARLEEVRSIRSRICLPSEAIVAQEWNVVRRQTLKINLKKVEKFMHRNGIPIKRKKANLALNLKQSCLLKSL